jgi:hypothetical protein
MKRTFIIVIAVVLLLGLGWLLIPHSVLKVELQTPTVAITPNVPAPTEVLATLNLPAQLTTVPTTNGTIVSYAGTSFTIQSDLANATEAETVPQSNDWFTLGSTHLKFVLQGYNLQDTVYEPQILVFPVAEYVQMSNDHVATLYDAKTMVANLQNILTTQQIPTLAYLIPIEGNNQGNYLPFLPDQQAAQVFHAQEKILPFQSGSGLRYITSFSQAHYPAIGPELLYTFQGLTSDGKYYVSVILPLNQPNLPAMSATAENDANYPAYLSSTVATLNQPEGEGVNPFAPSLASLDALVQSITVLDSSAYIPSTNVPSNLWRTYQSALYGFTFEYPAVYEDAAYKDTCGLKETAEGIQIGQRIEVRYLDSGGLSLAEFADNFVKGQGWNVDSQSSASINGSDAISVQYRFGGTNRFGSITFISNNGRIYAVNFSAGSFCEMPDAQASEPNAYSRIVESFRFDQAVTPSPASLPGTITGRLSYPSEFIPTLKVVALDVTNPSVYYFVNTEMNQSEYLLQVPPGTYYIISYVNRKDGTLGAPGAYSQYVICGLQASCSDHSLTPVTVAAGQTVTGIDPADWYAPEGTFPAIP